MTQAYLQQFETFAANGGSGRGPDGFTDPHWLPGLRRAAMERFSALGFPSPRNEDWHYTSVQPITQVEFRPVQKEQPTVSPADIEPFQFASQWPSLVFVNGRLSLPLSSLARLPDGVRVVELAVASGEKDPLLERYLSKIARFDDAPFTALNTAFMKHGALIHIGRDVSCEEPVHLLFFADATAADRVMHPRTLIVAERNSKATVIESYVAGSVVGYFVNAVTEVALEDGAALTHFKIQRESKRAFHVGTSEVRQGRDSHYVSFSFASGAALSRTNIYTVLDGAGAGATLNGLYMVDGDQHVDHQTRIEHAKPNCFSREMYKGILDGSSHGVFNGKVYVQPEAQKTDGKQTNNNLLLSDRARVDTKPQLEIFADDVKCTHGATVGRMDEQARFYMRSRGIPDARTRNLLTYAFAADVLEQITVDPVRIGLERLTLERFAGAAEDAHVRSH
ncbi:MAG: Fe-S cluster assembly protein SufD [Gemmatimonadaceae bacterium]